MLVDALDTDENAYLVELITVAQKWGVPPLTAIGGRPNVWRVDDTVLAAAHARYLATRVGPSGYPLRVAGDEAQADAWEVDDSVVDFAQTAMNRWSQGRDQDDDRAVIPRVEFQRTIPPWER